MRIFRIMPKFLVFILTIELLFACNIARNNVPNVLVPGVAYVTSRGKPRAESIVWSPKASTNVLVSAVDLVQHNSQVYFLDIASKKKTVLFDTDYSGVIGKGWSPDGMEITLSVDGATKRFSQRGLWMMNTEDNSLELLFDRPSDVIWLSDGKMLAFLTLDLASGQNPRRVSIYLMNIQTRESKLIYSNEEAIAYSGFSSSPDGNYLVFSLDFGAYNAVSDLYILDAQTGAVSQVTYDNASSGSQWSPIGDLIVYVKSSKVGNEMIHSLHITLPDGSCDVEVPHIKDAFSPTWSPDGKEIAFIGKDGIYVLDTDIVFGRDIYENLCP